MIGTVTTPKSNWFEVKDTMLFHISLVDNNVVYVRTLMWFPAASNEKKIFFRESSTKHPHFLQILGCLSD